MYQFDADKLHMEPIEILGIPGLFTAQRINRSSLPQGMYAYDLQASEDRWMRPTLIARPAVESGYCGTVLTAAPVELPEDGFCVLGPDDLDISFGGERLTTAEFERKYLPPKLPFAVARYITKEDLDFEALPLGSYIAEEVTPPRGFLLSSDVSKVKQPFVWDGEHDVSLIFENSAKVRVQLKKVDESGNPLAGAVFVILRDGQIIGTEETKADGTITVSNVVEGYHEFREVHAPDGFDKDPSPVGVYVNAEDLQGEQTIVVTKVNHRQRALTISKRDLETGAPVPNTSFHISGVNQGYENDVVTGADGTVTLSDMPSGCYEITETDVPAPYLLDANNRKTVWIDAAKDQDVVADFRNSTRPGLRLLKRDQQTGAVIGWNFVRKFHPTLL